MTSGLNHPSGSTVLVELTIGDEAAPVLDDDRASKRMGGWRLTSRRPVDMLKVIGTACRLRAPRQRAIVAIVLVVVFVFSEYSSLGGGRGEWRE